MIHFKCWIGVLNISKLREIRELNVEDNWETNILG